MTNVFSNALPLDQRLRADGQTSLFRHAFRIGVLNTGGRQKKN